MPSPAATALTRLHRRELAVVAALLGRRVGSAAARADATNIDAWWDRVGGELQITVARSATVTAALGARYLRRHAAAEGVVIEPVRSAPTRGQINTSLLVTGPVAFKTHMRDTGDPGASLLAMATRLTGAAQRLALAGDRDTVIGTINSTDRIVGYRRITDGDPCFFCAMLASRGAVYSERTVGFQAHDHDSCSAEPLYEREDEPADVLALREQWDEATAGKSGAEAMNAFRQARAAS